MRLISLTKVSLYSALNDCLAYTEYILPDRSWDEECIKHNR